MKLIKDNVEEYDPSIVAISAEGRTEWKVFEYLFDPFDEDEKVASFYEGPVVMPDLSKKDLGSLNVGALHRAEEYIKDYKHMIVVVDREHFDEDYQKPAEEVCKNKLEKTVGICDVSVDETVYDRVLRYVCTDGSGRELKVHVVTLDGKYKCFENRFAALLEMHAEDDPRENQEIKDCNSLADARSALKGAINGYDISTVLDDANQRAIRKSFPFFTILMSEFENGGYHPDGDYLKNHLDHFLESQGFDWERNNILSSQRKN